MIVFQVLDQNLKPTIRTGITGTPTAQEIIRHLKCAKSLPFSLSEIHITLDLTRWPEEVAVFSLWDGFSLFRHEPKLWRVLKATTPENQLDLFDVGPLPTKYIPPAEAMAMESGIARAHGFNP